MALRVAGRLDHPRLGASDLDGVAFPDLDVDAGIEADSLAGPTMVQPVMRFTIVLPAVWSW
jgi:hypothetical protein